MKKTSSSRMSIDVTMSIDEPKEPSQDKIELKENVVKTKKEQCSTYENTVFIGKGKA